MRWHFVLILSTLWHYAMAVCPAGEQYSGTVCITKIEYECNAYGSYSCWEDEISFNIEDTNGDVIHTSPPF